MSQHETSIYSITEKAKSERLFMHYSLLLASLLTLIGTVLIVLGIGNHLDIVVKGTGSLEARFINASPGFGMAVLGLIMLGWAKPRRLQLNARHEQASIEATHDFEEFEESMRELVYEIETRTRRIDAQRHARFVVDLKRVLSAQLGVAFEDKDLVGETEVSRAPEKTGEESKIIRSQTTSLLDVKFSRGERSGEVPPFDASLSDADKIKSATEWLKRKSDEGAAADPKRKSAPIASSSDELDVLYQSVPKK